MVWSASTLWAETADGTTQRQWNAELQRNQATSGNSPQPDAATRCSKKHLQKWRTRHPEDRTTGAQVSRAWGQPPPMPEKRSYTAPLELQPHRTPVRDQSSSATLDPTVGGAEESSPQGPSVDHVEPAEGRDWDDMEEEEMEAEEEISPGEEEPEVESNAPSSPSSPIGKKPSSRSPSPSKAPVEQSLEALPRLKRTATEVSLLRKERVKNQRADRLSEIRERNWKNYERTLQVKQRADARIQRKQEDAAVSIARRERRKLGPIDRCETDADRQVLRAEGYIEYIQHAFVVNFFASNLKRQKALRRLRYLFYPIACRFMNRKRILVAAYAAVWKGRLPHPTIEQVQEILPPLLFWPEYAIQRVLGKMKPRKLLPGRTLAYELEPCTAVFIIVSGKISIRQNSHGGQSNNKPAAKGKANSREIGDKRGRSCFGEDSILKKYASKHVANLVVVETTYLWVLSRKDFQNVAVSVPCAKSNQQNSQDLSAEQQEAGAVVVDGQVVLPLHPHQIRENKCFKFWPLDEVTKLLAKCTYKHYPRGSQIYSVDDQSTKAFVVWKGTVELTIATGINALNKMKERTRRLNQNNTEGEGEVPGEGQTPSNILAQSSDLNISALDGSPKGGEIGSPGQRSFRKRLLAEDKAFSPNVGRSYVNVGQVFGEEAVLFRMNREGTATAATDALVYEIPPLSLVDGCYSNPAAFYELMMSLNHQRAIRLPRPSQAVYTGLLTPPVIPTFQRMATAEVYMKGESLPLNAALVYLQQGSVTWNGVLYEAPVVLGNAETLKSNLVMYETAVQETHKEMGHTASRSALAAAIEVKLSNAQIPHIVVPNKTASRVDAWVLDFILLLRKCPKVARLSDVLVAAAEAEAGTGGKRGGKYQKKKL